MLLNVMVKMWRMGALWIFNGTGCVFCGLFFSGTISAMF